ncbi:hypothetical protein, partial [Methanosarcina spelaei]|uniref:hypothetical protein n=1 Tax=Methanosarcina spelaei TaxID=1036679 RepID=UPI001BB0481B
ERNMKIYTSSCVNLPKLGFILESLNRICDKGEKSYQFIIPKSQTCPANHILLINPGHRFSENRLVPDSNN